jgi:hypothetical protein
VLGGDVSLRPGKQRIWQVSVDDIHVAEQA